MVVGFQVVMCLFQQWIIPSVKNSLIPFSVSMKTLSLCSVTLDLHCDFVTLVSKEEGSVLINVTLCYVMYSRQLCYVTHHSLDTEQI